MSEYISDLIISKDELRENFILENSNLIKEFTIVVNNIISKLVEKGEFSCKIGYESKINDIKYKTIRSIVLLEYIKKGYNFKQSTSIFSYDGQSLIDLCITEYLEITPCLQNICCDI